MRVISAQVFDPIYHPDAGVRDLPARMEILVEDMDPERSTAFDTIGEWSVAQYGEYCYLFWHEGNKGQRPQFPDEPYNEETLMFHEGYLNALGITEPLVPVTVAVRNARGVWRDFYVPARLVLGWLASFVPATEIGRWDLQVSREWALQNQIVFEFVFVPNRAENLREQNARQGFK